MDHPIAFRSKTNLKQGLLQVDIDSAIAKFGRGTADHPTPAIIFVRDATLLSEKQAGIIEPSDVIKVIDGNWAEAILVVSQPQQPENDLATGREGDTEFLAEVQKRAPSLLGLAQHTLEGIRASGVKGDLERMRDGKWVNKPVNVFTLKVQPRVGNLQFTLYGEPYKHDAKRFLKKDQNSYSRGWVKDTDDAHELMRLAVHAQLLKAN